MLIGAELKQDDQVVGSVMLRAGRVVITAEQDYLRQSLERGVLGRDKKFHKPAEGEDYVRAVVFQFSGSHMQALPIHEEPRTLAAKHPPTAVHDAADAHVAKLSVAIRYAFAQGRTALKRHPGDAKVAAMAVRTALLQVLPKTLLKIVADGGAAGLELLGKQMRAAEFRIARPQVPGEAHTVKPPFKLAFNVSNPNAVKWAQEHAAELAKNLSDTTEQAIRDAVARAQEEGDLEQMRQDILDAVGDEARAEMIARTETMMAANEGQRQSWDQAVEAGLLTGDERRVWIATDDGHVCPDCEALDGETTGLDGEYPNDGGDGPPLHPNCRCTEGIGSLETAEFNPDQPRDEKGQWSSGDGYPSNGEVSQTGLDKRFPIVGKMVDGRTVTDHVPNTGSISASLTNYVVLSGIREVKISEFEDSGKPKFYSTAEEKRTQALAERIKSSNEIAPLIVVVDVDKRGPYILEGGHRFDALKLVGAKSFPAMIVIDTESLRVNQGE